jgi:hypothetical protein
MHPVHAAVVRLETEAEAKSDERLWQQAARAWDLWTDTAEALGVCLNCEAPTDGAAYCDKEGVE